MTNQRQTGRLSLSAKDARDEADRAIAFLASEVRDEPAVVAVSGGLDSDVVARLTCQAIGRERLKLFIVLQESMDPRHIANAVMLAEDLSVALVQIDLQGMPLRLIEALASADAAERFAPAGLLDPARAKCSIRTPILSTYQDRGYVVIGTSNRTELETGFFLPFGDGLAHIQPIVHLYKTQVRNVADVLGVRREVLDQPASSGFWLGAEDLWDIAFWLYVGEPIRFDRGYSQEEIDTVSRIRAELTTESVDAALWGLARGFENRVIAEEAQLGEEVVVRFRTLVESARPRKQRPFFRRLECARC